MAKDTKIKEWKTRARADAERAERAADRAEAALREMRQLAGDTSTGDALGNMGEPEDAGRRPPFYTEPRDAEPTPA